VENECKPTAYNYNYFFVNLPEIIKIRENLTKYWQKQFVQFFM